MLYEKEDEVQTRLNADAEKIFTENFERIKKAFKQAINSSRDLGHGFVVVDRDRYLKNSFNIRAVSWMDVESCLKNIGARGGLTDREEAKCLANRKRRE